MKTPREVLLASHRQAEPRLDSLRHQVVSQMARTSAQPSRLTNPAAGRAGEGTWASVLGFFRWHLVGLCSAWLLIAALRASGGGAGATPPAVVKPVLSHSVIFSLKENRRQIIESDNDLNPAASERGKTLPQSRHSRLWMNQA